MAFFVTEFLTVKSEERGTSCVCVVVRTKGRWRDEVLIFIDSEVCFASFLDFRIVMKVSFFSSYYCNFKLLIWQLFIHSLFTLNSFFLWRCILDIVLICNQFN